MNENRIGKNNPNWQGGKPHCKDCGKCISYYAKRCSSCSAIVKWKKYWGKGEKNPSWKGIKRSWKYKYYRYKKIYQYGWLKIFNPKPKCEVCNKKLKYFSGDKNNVVTFDHRKGETVIYSPHTWLLRHNPFIKKNIIKWKQMDFGILCNNCNVKLPTKRRISWLKRALKYAYRR